MEENKYYTPEIEEFHIGFEFEVLIPTQEWIKVKFNGYKELYLTENINLSLEEFIKAKYIRVKHLNKEDIESLGFTLTKTFSSPYTGKELYSFQLIKEEGFNTGSKYFITLNDRDITIEIQTYGSYDTFQYKMNFIIKNKSELIKILKMIGIYEEPK